MLNIHDATETVLLVAKVLTSLQPDQEVTMTCTEVSNAIERIDREKLCLKQDYDPINNTLRFYLAPADPSVDNV